MDIWIILTGVLALIIIVLFGLLSKAQSKIKKLESDVNKTMESIEKRVRLSDKYSRTLAEVADKTFEAVIITDKNGIIEWVNQGFTKITGYGLTEVIGKKPGEVLQGPDTDPETVERIRKKLSQKVIFKEEILNYHKKGYPYWLSLSISPILDAAGNVEKFIAIESDITQQKKERQQLEAELEKIKNQI